MDPCPVWRAAPSRRRRCSTRRHPPRCRRAPSRHFSIGPAPFPRASIGGTARAHLRASGTIPAKETCMRKLSLLVAALFLFASAPALAQTTEQKSETKSETSGPSGESKESTTKKSSKKHKKTSAKKKKAAAD